jgi:CopG family transcriptional regulator/antitoxin EndoAI
MSKRINIVLPEATIHTIDRLAKPGERSRFINTAVQHYVANRSAEALRAQLERAAILDRDLDTIVAADWSAANQETWRRLDAPPTAAKRPATRSGAKSPSRRSIQRSAGRSKRRGPPW